MGLAEYIFEFIEQEFGKQDKSRIINGVLVTEEMQRTYCYYDNAIYDLAGPLFAEEDLLYRPYIRPDQELPLKPRDSFDIPKIVKDVAFIDNIRKQKPTTKVKLDPLIDPIVSIEGDDYIVKFEKNGVGLDFDTTAGYKIISNTPFESLYINNIKHFKFSVKKDSFIVLYKLNTTTKEKTIVYFLLLNKVSDVDDLIEINYKKISSSVLQVEITFLEELLISNTGSKLSVIDSNNTEYVSTISNNKAIINLNPNLTYKYIKFDLILKFSNPVISFDLKFLLYKEFNFSQQEENIQLNLAPIQELWQYFDFYSQGNYTSFTVNIPLQYLEYQQNFSLRNNCLVLLNNFVQDIVGNSPVYTNFNYAINYNIYFYIVPKKYPIYCINFSKLESYGISSDIFKDEDGNFYPYFSVSRNMWWSTNDNGAYVSLYGSNFWYRRTVFIPSYSIVRDCFDITYLYERALYFIYLDNNGDIHTVGIHSGQNTEIAEFLAKLPIYGNYTTSNNQYGYMTTEIQYNGGGGIRPYTLIQSNNLINTIVNFLQIDIYFLPNFLYGATNYTTPSDFYIDHQYKSHEVILQGDRVSLSLNDHSDSFAPCNYSKFPFYVGLCDVIRNDKLKTYIDPVNPIDDKIIPSSGYYLTPTANDYFNLSGFVDFLRMSKDKNFPFFIQFQIGVLGENLSIFVVYRKIKESAYSNITDFDHTPYKDSYGNLFLPYYIIGYDINTNPTSVVYTYTNENVYYTLRESYQMLLNLDYLGFTDFDFNLAQYLGVKKVWYTCDLKIRHIQIIPDQNITTGVFEIYGEFEGNKMYVFKLTIAYMFDGISFNFVRENISFEYNGKQHLITKPLYKDTISSIALTVKNPNKTGSSKYFVATSKESFVNTKDSITSSDIPNLESRGLVEYVGINIDARKIYCKESLNDTNVSEIEFPFVNIDYKSLKNFDKFYFNLYFIQREFDFNTLNLKFNIYLEDIFGNLHSMFTFIPSPSLTIDFFSKDNTILKTKTLNLIDGDYFTVNLADVDLALFNNQIKITISPAPPNIKNNGIIVSTNINTPIEFYTGSFEYTITNSKITEIKFKPLNKDFLKYFSYYFNLSLITKQNTSIQIPTSAVTTTSKIYFYIEHNSTKERISFVEIPIYQIYLYNTAQDKSKANLLLPSTNLLGTYNPYDFLTLEVNPIKQNIDSLLLSIAKPANLKSIPTSPVYVPNFYTDPVKIIDTIPDNFILFNGSVGYTCLKVSSNITHCYFNCIFGGFIKQINTVKPNIIIKPI